MLYVNDIFMINNTYNNCIYTFDFQESNLEDMPVRRKRKTLKK